MTGALSPAAGHALLGLSGAALATAALRAVSVLAPRGPERVIAAAAMAVSTACLQALALGLLDLGASPAALAATALATFAASRRWLPAPELSVATELAGWWERRGRLERAALGALAGLAAAWTAWMLKYPFLGEDAVRYRLPTVIAWVQEGSPGALYTAAEEYRTDAYPLGNELALSWAMAIARSFVPATLWTPALVALAALAGWHGLRSVGVPRPSAALAILAVCSLPIQVARLNEPNSDTPALAWAVCAGALCASARHRPALIAPALLAGGLAIGAKTTAAVPVLAALAAGLWLARGSLRAHRRVLVAAAAVALIVGGLWYVRNLILHGSPIWPFGTAPWGDPAPPVIEALDHSLLERPRATLRGNLDAYLATLAGGMVLAVGALLSPLAGRSKASLIAAAVATLALLSYAAAPVTGLGDAGLIGFPLLTLRYLLPALAACALAVALAARAGGRAAVAATAALAGSSAWSIGRDLALDYPPVPSIATLALGVALGALAALVLGGPLRRLVDRPPGLRRALAAAGALVGGLALSLPAAGYVERNARIAAAPSVEIPRFFTEPAAPPERAAVAFSPASDARVAGDRLRRPLRVVPRDAPCERYRRDWAVLTTSSSVLNTVSDLDLAPGALERCIYSDPPLVSSPSVAIYPPRRGITARVSARSP